MALSDNPYLDLPMATLLLMQSQYLQVQSDLAGGGKSYSFPGRTFTRADYGTIRAILVDVRTAIRYQNGTGKVSAQARVDTQNQVGP